MKAISLAAVILLIVITCTFLQCNSPVSSKVTQNLSDSTASVPVFVNTPIPDDSAGRLIQYGRELIVQTAYYIGPEGINGKYTGSKVSCTNCHQNAGTKKFSFDLLTAYSRYPQYRARENRILSLADRVNNCIERPLNGKALDNNSREMQALLAYLKWLDSFVPADKKKEFGKSLEISFMNRSADPAKGAVVYATHCARCHGENGEGKPGSNNYSYQYPVLWGDSAYQPGSSLHRVIKMAAWLKANMPYDSATYLKPILTDEEATDVAAFVNDDRIHPRPTPKNFDYPVPEKKPIDYGRGPFADTFSAMQHKFGPWPPIIDYWKKKGLKPAF
jgi:thiosulfate dehydrogenase